MNIKFFSIVSVLIVAAISIGATTDKPEPKDGKTIFLEQKCSNCHSVASQGIIGLRPEGGAKPNDLSDEGNKFKTDWFEQWLMKTATLNNKKHMRKFRGTTEELHTLAHWLESLKVK